MHNDGRLNSMEGGAMRTSLGDERRNNQRDEQRDEQRNNQAFNFAIIRWFWKRAGNKFVDLYDLLGITQQRFDRSMSGESIWIARKEAAHCKNVTGMDADIFTGKKRFLPNQPLQESKLIGFEPNRRFGQDVLVGDFYVVGTDGENLASLPQDKMEKYAALFAEPEDISEEEVAQSMMMSMFFF